jgi:A/G-specific adenine glycosylase
LGYYARARNLHRCAIAVTRSGGRFPQTEEELLALPGIGPYTAAAIAAIAFDQPATVVDGNIERVMTRLHAETGSLPGIKVSLRQHAAALTPALRPGDYAQAVMDLGAMICTPRRPACENCPWRDTCRGRALGIAGNLPLRAQKQAKPVRHGTAFLALDQLDRILTERRPEGGLLGGMLALPSTDWAQTAPPATPPFEADWRPAGEVRHTFTHFHLRLSVQWIRVQKLPDEYPRAAEAEAAMPTVFAKASRLGRRTAGG